MSQKYEIWLRANTRAIWMGGVLLCALSWLIGLAALGLGAPLVLVLSICAAVTLLLLLALARLVRQPRLAYSAGSLLAYLQFGEPIRIPIDVVECVFLGQGPALVPGPAGSQDKPDVETSTLILRLAESAADWKHGDVHKLLGLWCEGYITIRGTWCEPITSDLARGLNAKLVAAQREWRAHQRAEETP